MTTHHGRPSLAAIETTSLHASERSSFQESFAAPSGKPSRDRPFFSHRARIALGKTAVKP